MKRQKSKPIDKIDEMRNNCENFWNYIHLIFFEIYLLFKKKMKMRINKNDKNHKNYYPFDDQQTLFVFPLFSFLRLCPCELLPFLSKIDEISKIEIKNIDDLILRN